MPFKSKRKRDAYAKRWREKNPGYMSRYCRSYYNDFVRKPKTPTDVLATRILTQHGITQK